MAITAQGVSPIFNNNLRNWRTDLYEQQKNLLPMLTISPARRQKNWPILTTNLAGPCCGKMLRNLLEFATNVLLKLVSIVNCSNTRNIHSEGTDLSKCFKQIWCAEKYTHDTCVYQVFHPSTCNYDRRSQYSITSALRRPNTCVFWFQIHHCCFTKEKLLLEKTAKKQPRRWI